MFNRDFYPTPVEIIEHMLDGEILEGKTILEPSAGKGNIVDYLKARGASVIACELNRDLQKIIQHKCQLLAEDFLTVTSDQISHVSHIVMNPPFSSEERHILHAFAIAPAGCRIISLCNQSIFDRTYGGKTREELRSVVQQYGNSENLGDAFSDAERGTRIEIALIRLQKPGASYEAEFEGFFLEEDQEAQENGIMPYNAIRDLVNRYVGAIKIYDKQLAAAVEMNALTSGFYNGIPVSASITQLGVPLARAEFKKSLQKSGWAYIFEKMNMGKIATRGLREDINKFVEQQSNIPFTMRNIYKMLEIVIGTTSQRMDRALLEVFDKITKHHDDNRYAVEGWKTNGHFLVCRKFILPWICYQDQRLDKGSKLRFGYNGNEEDLNDLVKALCYLTGDRWEDFGRLGLCEATYGEWFEWAFFRCKGFKKGSMHFEFKDPDLWAKFNQRIAKIKGYPLFEAKEQTAYQRRQTGRKVA